MNSALKWKLIAGFLLVFMAGCATGVFVTMGMAHRFIGGAHPHGMVANAMKNRLRWQLKLTDEQMAKVSPIIDKTGAKLEEIRGDTGRKVRDTIMEAHHEIAPLLTAEQQQRLKQMENRQGHWMHHGPRWQRNASPLPETSPSGEPSPE